MSSRAKKKAAVSRLRELKQKRKNGEISGTLDEIDIKEDDDVYDVVNEEEYENIVESRRQREDFVVDDDGLGYYDDGEETFSEDYDRKKKRNTSNALTNRALKKARKNIVKTKKNDEEEITANNKSMWDFVRVGTNNGGNRKSSNSAGVGASTSAGGTNAMSTEANVDALLGQLDDDNIIRSNRGRSSGRHRRRSRSSGGGSKRKGSSSSSSRRHQHHRRSRSSIERENDDYEEEHNDDTGCAFPESTNDDDDQQMTSDVGMTTPEKKRDARTDSDTLMGDEEDLATATKGTAARGDSKVRFADDENIPSATTVKSTTTTANGGSSATAVSPEKQQQKEQEPPRRRRQVAKPMLGRLSAPARKALEEKERQKNISTNSERPTTTATPVDITKGISFTPDDIASVQQPLTTLSSPSKSSFSASAASSKLETYIEKNNDNDDQYLDMFWMDIAQRNGEILLFGKVAAKSTPSSSDKNTKSKQYVSCCAIIKNHVKNLFVLPRKKADGSGEYESMMDVHSEINEIIHKSCMPRIAGANWKGKMVKRKYAFGDSSIPREETEYLKVVYDAQYKVPPDEVCEQGGRYFQRILGARTSNIEQFIIKRKLKGPCWIRIRNPQANGESGTNISWCKLEISVASPKDVTRVDLLKDDNNNTNNTNRPAPPIVAVSIKLKTVVNPKTHKSEIVSVSAICHKQIQLDTASDESKHNMTQLSLIRPLPRNDTADLNFPRDIDKEISTKMPQLKRLPNERALLSRLLAQLGTWDPDVIVGHNAWGFDVEVLLTRALDLKVSQWSKLGRRRIMKLRSKLGGGKKGDGTSSSSTWAVQEATSGRLICDTYLSAKEHVRQTTYTLSNLSAELLKTNRQEIEPVDIPKWFTSSQTIVQLAMHTLFDAQLVQRLLFKLQILPLSKQLTCIAGNIWSHTLKSNRAERTEYLLLHEFHQLKYLAPEKRKLEKGGKNAGRKSKYGGGLVLEPKRGLYDSFILLLDFNSLYPSLIQEYNLCFTTIEDWSNHQAKPRAKAPPPKNDNGEIVVVEDSTPTLPPLPDEEASQGVLPRVIKSLVDRRRAVKRMMKNEKNEDKKKELDIRQMALKLTANSMYGCLGFSNSRFFAQPIAALVTAKGRETLQRTVTIAEEVVGLDVIYGDTDSIMINTRISDETSINKVREFGERVKKEVNKLYKTLELEIDGIFRSMLLLKKKKYAAKTVIGEANGKLSYGQELKGLDLVRRDWCIQSKDSGKFVTEQILSGLDNEVVVDNIHKHLEELGNKMRSYELPLDKYVITKGLSKHPNDYPDAKSQPHVQVAKVMIKNNIPVNSGDHIPYVITAETAVPEKTESNSDQKKMEQSSSSATKSSFAERARHPDDVIRSGGTLKPDIEWYLTQQILPPISRLCEPINGTSQSIIAQKLGLDPSRYGGNGNSNNSNGSKNNLGYLGDDGDMGYTPESQKLDEERFNNNITKLKIKCFSCGETNEFPGVLHCSFNKDSDKKDLVFLEGFKCTNPDCARPDYWGNNNYFEIYSRIANLMSNYVKNIQDDYYKGIVKCDDLTCQLQTRQLSVCGTNCLSVGCNGKMKSVVTEKCVHTHLKYLESLFDYKHCMEQIQKKHIGDGDDIIRSKDLRQSISKHGLAAFNELHKLSKNYMKSNSYNWVTPNIWQLMAQQLKQ